MGRGRGSASVWGGTSGAPLWIWALLVCVCVGVRGRKAGTYTEVATPSCLLQNTQLAYLATGSLGSHSVSHFLQINFFQTGLNFLLRTERAIASLINLCALLSSSPQQHLFSAPQSGPPAFYWYICSQMKLPHSHAKIFHLPQSSFLPLPTTLSI